MVKTNTVKKWVREGLFDKVKEFLSDKNTRPRDSQTVEEYLGQKGLVVRKDNGSIDLVPLKSIGTNEYEIPPRGKRPQKKKHANKKAGKKPAKPSVDKQIEDLQGEVKKLEKKVAKPVKKASKKKPSKKPSKKASKKPSKKKPSTVKNKPAKKTQKKAKKVFKEDDAIVDAFASSLEGLNEQVIKKVKEDSSDFDEILEVEGILVEGYEPIRKVKVKVGKKVFTIYEYDEPELLDPSELFTPNELMELQEEQKAISDDFNQRHGSNKTWWWLTEEGQERRMDELSVRISEEKQIGLSLDFLGLAQMGWQLVREVVMNFDTLFPFAKLSRVQQLRALFRYLREEDKEKYMESVYKAIRKTWGQ